MADKRRLTRFEIDGKILVFDRGAAKPLGRIENLSVEGLMLCTDQPVETKKLFRISITLPVLINGKSTIRCRAESRWSDRSVWSGKASSQYCAGFQIKDISAHDKETLESLIKRFGSPIEKNPRSASTA